MSGESETSLQEVAVDLIKALRGERSQEWLNRKLGLTFNQVSKWENAHKRILWPEFVALASGCGVTLGKALRALYNFRGAADDTAAFLRHLTAFGNQSDLAKRLGISLSTLKRWLKGSSTPSLSDVLAVIDFSQNMLVEFLLSFTEIDKLPALSAKKVQSYRYKQLHYRHPETSQILCCLTLEEYRRLRRHSDSYVASILGLRKELVSSILVQLEEIGVVTKASGKFVSRDDDALLIGSYDGTKRLKLHFLTAVMKALEASTEPSESLACGYQICAVNEEGLAVARKKYQEYYADLYETLDRHRKNPSRILVIQHQIFDLKNTQSAFKPVAPDCAPTNSAIESIASTASS